MTAGLDFHYFALLTPHFVLLQVACSAAAGGAGYDVEQHTPKHRIWGSRGAQRSYWAMFLIGFAMAFDFTAALMSIQPLYYITGAC